MDAHSIRVRGAPIRCYVIGSSGESKSIWASSGARNRGIIELGMIRRRWKRREEKVYYVGIRSRGQVLGLKIKGRAIRSGGYIPEFSSGQEQCIGGSRMENAGDWRWPFVVPFARRLMLMQSGKDAHRGQGFNEELLLIQEEEAD